MPDFSAVFRGSEGLKPAAVMNLWIPGDPKPKSRPRFSRKTGAVYTPGRTAREEAVIRAFGGAWVEKQGWDAAWEGPVAIRAYYLVAKPADYWPGKQPKSGDLDNFGKLVADALQKVVFKNDSQIIGRTEDKAYSDTPGIYLRVFFYGLVEKPRKRKKS